MVVNVLTIEGVDYNIMNMIHLLMNLTITIEMKSIHVESPLAAAGPGMNPHDGYKIAFKGGSTMERKALTLNIHMLTRW